MILANFHYRKKGVAMARIAFSSPLMVSLAVSLASGPVEAQPSSKEQGFVVYDQVMQGMSETAFVEYARQKGLEVTTPLPDTDAKSVKLGGTQYMLSFCGGRLTYASWLLDDNAAFIKSMDRRVSDLGFTIKAVSVASDYSDMSQKDVNTLTMKLERYGAPYSVTYTLFDNNGQVVVEDVGYDDSYGCEGDGR